MRPWLKRTLVGVFGASALFGGLSACSHHSYGHGGWRAMSDEDVAQFKSRAVERMASRLELDAAQKAKLGVLLDRLQEQRTALRGSGDLRQQMQTLVADSTFERWRAQELVNAKLDAVREKSPQVIAAMGDFYDSLKPEQQQKVREFMQRRSGGWGRHG